MKLSRRMLQWSKSLVPYYEHILWDVTSTTNFAPGSEARNIVVKIEKIHENSKYS